MVYRILYDDSYDFNWYYLFGIPIAYGFIKYGWRWIRNIIDITEEDYLSHDGSYYRNAVRNAQISLQKFLNYVEKGEEECYAKLPFKTAEEKTERLWCIVHFFDNEKHQLNVSIMEEVDEEMESGRKFINPEHIEDWQVVKDEGVLGFFTYLAGVKKAKDEGYRLNYKSKRVKESILT